MLNIREQIEKDLAETLEGKFGLPVELTAPDGTSFTAIGQVLYDRVQFNVETNEDMVVEEPIVVLRRSSLPRIPISGETWHVKIPVIPNRTAPKVDFITSKVRSPSGGGSIGYIKIYLQKAEQI